jgi:hypothetical protein
MFSPNSFNVKSSWPVLVNNTEPPKLLSGAEAENLLRHCLKVHQGPFDFDPETMVEVESCVQLQRPFPEPDESSEKIRSQCEVIFECVHRNLTASRLVLVSQCKRVEVYGPHGQYELTKEGVLLGKTWKN